MKKAVKSILILIFFMAQAISIPLLYCKAPFGTCSTPIIKAGKSVKKGPYELFPDNPEDQPLTEDTLLQAIKNASQAAFFVDSPSMKFSDENNPIDEKKFIAWVNLLSCMYNWLEANKKKQYLPDITNLYTISNFIYALAKDLNTKTLTAPEKKFYEKNIQSKLQQLIEINKGAVNALEKATSYSSAWKNSVGTTSQLKTILEEYSDKLIWYDQLKKSNKYLTQEQYFKTLFEELNPLSLQSDRKTLENHVNDLEQITYRLQLTKSFDIFNLKHQLALSKFTQSFLKYIISTYGNGLYFASKGLNDKFESSNDLALKSVMHTTARLFKALDKIYNEIKK